MKETGWRSPRVIWAALKALRDKMIQHAAERLRTSAKPASEQDAPTAVAANPPSPPEKSDEPPAQNASVSGPMKPIPDRSPLSKLERGAEVYATLGEGTGAVATR